MADLKGMLQNVVSNLVNLQTVTYVGDVKIEGDLTNIKVKIGENIAKSYMITNVNLLAGDIVTIIHPSLADNSMPRIGQLHNDMQEKASSIVERNVRMLNELIQSGVELIIPDQKP